MKEKEEEEDRLPFPYFSPLSFSPSSSRERRGNHFHSATTTFLFPGRKEEAVIGCNYNLRRSERRRRRRREKIGLAAQAKLHTPPPPPCMHAPKRQPDCSDPRCSTLNVYMRSTCMHGGEGGCNILFLPSSKFVLRSE